MRRFIILAHPRSGSTLLVAALEQHPGLRVYNELLTNTEPEEARRRHYSLGERWLADDSDGADFLRHVFTQENGEAGVGFKLMHHHASAPPHSTAWDFLRADADLHVIALHRDDLLATVVSNELALRTGVWNVESDSPLPDQVAPFTLGVEHCREQLDRLAASATRARQLFPEQPLLELEYQRDLSGDYDATVARVFRFLGIAPIPTRKRLARMARRSPREQLANFDELAAAFAGTLYARYFR